LFVCAVSYRSNLFVCAVSYRSNLFVCAVSYRSNLFVCAVITGVTCLGVLLVTRVTSSLLPANADVKNVWNVISTHAYIHNVSVHS